MPKISREPLTRNRVENAKPTGKLWRLRDATVPGLALRISPNGSKSWAVTWGRGQEKTFGDFPVMTLDGARQQARKLLGEIAEHGAPLATVEARKPKALTLGDYIRDHYAPWAKANQKAGQATVDAIGAVFGDLYDRELAALSPFEIERIKAARLKAGIKPSTVNRDLSRIRGALSRAVDWSLIETHPMRTVKATKGADDSRVRYLSKPEEKALRKALEAREAQAKDKRRSYNKWLAERGREPLPAFKGYSDHLAPMTLLALNTGMRRGELLGLRWEDVDLPGKTLKVTAGNAKSRKARHIPLNREALEVLRTTRKDGEAGLVFPSPKGKRMGNINSSWEALLEAAGIEGFRFHDLRHTFASRLVMAGVDLNTVRELLGHSDIRMTLRYAHLAPDKLAQAVALLAT